MSRDTRRAITPQIVIGLFLVAIGAVLTFERLFPSDFIGETARLLWPVGLLALGGVLVATRTDAGGRWWGYAWLVVGGWWLLRTTAVISIGFGKLIGPVILIAIGWRLLTQARHESTSSDETGRGESMTAVMSENRRTITVAFRGTSMTSFMGGCVLDLRQATIEPGGEAVINVFAFMGGIEVVVPGHWTVSSQVAPIMGGIEDKRLPPIPATSMLARPDGAAAVAPRLILNGTIIMGGLVIKT